VDNIAHCDYYPDNYHNPAMSQRQVTHNINQNKTKHAKFSEKSQTQVLVFL
jgi:hypothetical protein